MKLSSRTTPFQCATCHDTWHNHYPCSAESLVKKCGPRGRNCGRWSKQSPGGAAAPVAACWGCGCVAVCVGKSPLWFFPLAVCAYALLYPGFSVAQLLCETFTCANASLSKTVCRCLWHVFLWGRGPLCLRYKKILSMKVMWKNAKKKGNN